MGYVLPPDERRCIRVREGNRCKKPRVIGLTVCEKHGGSTKASKQKSARAKVHLATTKFAKPIDGNDWEANPLNSFEMEFRRTVGRIRYYDEKLGELREQDLVWGKTKEETKTATEFSGVDTTNESKANLYHELQFQERKHLTELHKIWISAKLDVTKLEIQRKYVEMLDVAITRSLGALGLDATDPEVRRVIRDNLMSIPIREIEA